MLPWNCFWVEFEYPKQVLKKTVHEVIYQLNIAHPFYALLYRWFDFPIKLKKTVYHRIVFIIWISFTAYVLSKWETIRPAISQVWSIKISRLKNTFCRSRGKGHAVGEQPLHFTSFRSSIPLPGNRNVYVCTQAKTARLVLDPWGYFSEVDRANYCCSQRINQSSDPSCQLFAQ